MADSSSAPLTKFEGWVAHGPDAVNGKMSWESYEPKRWEENDVDIKVTHCGICGSDLHTLNSGWGPTAYPCVVGHEIVGHAVRVGKDVKNIKLGDRVGVGAISDSCFGRFGPCKHCDNDRPQFCRTHHVETYNSKHLNGDKTYGGYATHARVPSGWVFKIPDGLLSEYAAPIMCAGATAYRPLKVAGVGPGKKVAIVGFGGIGHFGVLWAKALGADEVVAVSRKRSKEADALTLGADRYIATDDDEDWATKNAGEFDVILLTVSSSNMPLSGYIKLLDVEGRMIMIGAPEGNLPSLNAFDFILSGASLGGSFVAGIKETEEMLALAVAKDVKPWVTVLPMAEANKAILDFESGKPRYRYVLKAADA